MEVEEDDTIDEIQCSGDGSPTPSYYWTFNSEHSHCQQTKTSGSTPDHLPGLGAFQF